VRLLQEATEVICEDTRSTKKLLQLLEIEYKQKRFHSLTSFIKQHQVDFYTKLLAEQDVVLVSDA
jgi:16S rRNA C1402 (ribose-2'-O) methylase RsmI